MLELVKENGFEISVASNNVSSSIPLMTCLAVIQSR